MSFEFIYELKDKEDIQDNVSFALIAKFKSINQDALIWGMYNGKIGVKNIILSWIYLFI